MHIFYVFFVFAGAQILEGGLLTPKLVGDKIGLHPVWIIFAVFAGGSLMGLSGIIIATPLAAITSVLIRLTLKKYRQSSLFKAS
jgi:predicted PurR-regulated permease PerM